MTDATATTSNPERIEGTVKWFSNRKGYGFITSTAGEDIFVHQSSIVSEGYRTLDENWHVEFSIGFDEDDGKPKAENVTAPGGGPCVGPKRPRRRRRGGDSEQNNNNNGGVIGSNADMGGEQEGRSASASASASNPDDAGAKSQSQSQRPPRTRTRPKKEPQPIWHDDLTEDVKQVLQNKHIPTSTGTIDISYQCHPHNDRIKLGTRGYASLANSDSYLAEGSFVSDPDGNITLEWERALHCNQDGTWSVCVDLSNFVTKLSLVASDVGPVGLEETMATLMGNHVTDPKSTLEMNDFLMRRVVLTTKKRESRSS